MSKSIITNFPDYCLICGKPREEMHHALYGNKHKLADEDKLLMPLCNYHHQDSKNGIHYNKEMKALSQMLAQACWERHYLAELLSTEIDRPTDDILKDARDHFFKRYGENFL